MTVRPASLALNKAAICLLPSFESTWVQPYAEVGKVCLVFCDKDAPDAVQFIVNTERPRAVMKRHQVVKAIVRRAVLPEVCRLRLVESTDTYLVFAI